MNIKLSILSTFVVDVLGGAMLTVAHASDRDVIISHQLPLSKPVHELRVVRHFRLPVGLPPQSEVSTVAGSTILGQVNSLLSASGFVEGAQGSGETIPSVLPVSFVGHEDYEDHMEKADDVTSMEYGVGDGSQYPFTTSRVDMYRTQLSKLYPFRPAGQLLFSVQGDTFACSASLIRPGIVVTAAHCVAEFGKKKFFSDFMFAPAYYKTSAPYGVWEAKEVVIKESYYKGTDNCADGAKGIVCENDVAVIELRPKLNNVGEQFYAGHLAGYFGYGWGGYGFSGQNLALVAQLGYPASHDRGKRMQKTLAQASVDRALAGNSIMGSRQTGGSSGGPWLINLGDQASLSGGVKLGKEAAENTVVGVTSWGYGDQRLKIQGASPFTKGNIKQLVNTLCPLDTSSKACR